MRKIYWRLGELDWPCHFSFWEVRTPSGHQTKHVATAQHDNSWIPLKWIRVTSLKSMNSQEEVEPWYFSSFVFISAIQVSEMGFVYHGFSHLKVTASVGVTSSRNMFSVCRGQCFHTPLTGTGDEVVVISSAVWTVIQLSSHYSRTNWCVLLGFSFSK